MKFPWTLFTVAVVFILLYVLWILVEFANLTLIFFNLVDYHLHQLFYGEDNQELLQKSKDACQFHLSFFGRYPEACKNYFYNPRTQCPIPDMYM